MDQKQPKQPMTAWQGVGIIVLILIILFFVWTAISGTIDASRMAS